jgi:hypothetical protein
MLPGRPYRVVVASLNICRWGVGCHTQTGRECQSYDPRDKLFCNPGGQRGVQDAPSAGLIMAPWQAEHVNSILDPNRFLWILSQFYCQAHTFVHPTQWIDQGCEETTSTGTKCKTLPLTQGVWFWYTLHRWVGDVSSQNPVTLKEAVQFTSGVRPILQSTRTWILAPNSYANSGL